MATGTRRTNRLLLLEIALVLLLIVLAIVFFIRPAADRMISAPWWRAPLLAALFFGVVGLHTWRRRRGGVSALHQTIREEARVIDPNAP